MTAQKLEKTHWNIATNLKSAINTTKLIEAKIKNGKAYKKGWMQQLFLNVKKLK